MEQLVVEKDVITASVYDGQEDNQVRIRLRGGRPVDMICTCVGGSCAHLAAVMLQSEDILENQAELERAAQEERFPSAGKAEKVKRGASRKKKEKKGKQQAKKRQERQEERREKKELSSPVSSGVALSSGTAVSPGSSISPGAAASPGRSAAPDVSNSLGMSASPGSTSYTFAASAAPTGNRMLPSFEETELREVLEQCTREQLMDCLLQLAQRDPRQREQMLALLSHSVPAESPDLSVAPQKTMARTTSRPGTILQVDIRSSGKPGKELKSGRTEAAPRRRDVSEPKPKAEPKRMEELVEEFLSGRQDPEIFSAVKALCPTWQWPDVRERLLDSIQDKDLYCRLCLQEGLTDWLRKKLLDPPDIELIDRYGDHLESYDSEDILAAYRDHVQKLVKTARSQRAYDQLMNYLWKMNHYDGGYEMVGKLTDQWLDQYSSRKALCLRLLMGV